MQLRSALVRLAVAPFLIGCASGSNSEPAFKTVAIDDAGAVRTTTTPGAPEAFAAPEAKVWDALAAAYWSIGRTVNLSEPAGHRMGSSNFYRSGRMYGQPVSHFANCGDGMTGPLADTRRVYFSVVTTATAVDATHTALVTGVSPTAVDISGGSSDRISCGSTGALEAMLYDAVARQLRAK